MPQRWSLADPSNRRDSIGPDGGQFTIVEPDLSPAAGKIVARDEDRSTDAAHERR
jgi:hypothetical protein